MTFDELGLSQPILQALDLKGYTTPTPIQEQAIPLVLEGRDLLGIAQTGTGKTAAFMLPGIDRLREAENQTPFKSCRMLILAPTRELATQIATAAKEYGALAGMKVQSVLGGTSVGKDRNKLHRGTDILVATPGRLLDLVDQKAFNLNHIEVLVLDEADQMLDLGFIHALRRINELVPKTRQTLFFSATMPKAIQQLVGDYLNNPAKVSVTPAASTAERIDQYLLMVQQNEKISLLEMIFQGRYQVPGKLERTLVFTRTKHGADRIVKALSAAGIYSNAIHGNKSQPQRQRALDEFRRGKINILIATDVAARGIDIPGVSHVINYELPNVPEQYVHRIGRTARAGAEGIAIAFCAEDERAYLKDITRNTDAEFDRLPLPENFREVVEGVGPTKPATRTPMKRVAPRPKGARDGGRDGGSREGGAREGGRERSFGGKPRGGNSGGSRFGDSRPPRREGSDSRPPRRDGEEGRPARREGGEARPYREGDNRPRREGGEARPFREGGGRKDFAPRSAAPRGDRPERSGRPDRGDARPARSNDRGNANRSDRPERSGGSAGGKPQRSGYAGGGNGGGARAGGQKSGGQRSGGSGGYGGQRSGGQGNSGGRSGGRSGGGAPRSSRQG